MEAEPEVGQMAQAEQREEEGQRAVEKGSRGRGSMRGIGR